MKALVMALGLVAITAAPAFAQGGAGPAAVPHAMNSGAMPAAVQPAGAPRLEMVADTIQPQKIVRGVNRGPGYGPTAGPVTGSSRIQWQLDPPAGFYLGGN